MKVVSSSAVPFVSKRDEDENLFYEFISKVIQNHNRASLFVNQDQTEELVGNMIHKKYQADFNPKFRSKKKLPLRQLFLKDFIETHRVEFDGRSAQVAHHSV